MSAKETIKRIVDSFNSKPHLKDKTREMGEGLMLGASLADDANELSKDVQAQVDQLVVEGDSSVEAAQARVDASGKAYTTLKKRLDEKEQETTAQFQQTGVNVMNFGAKGDGVTDDGQAALEAHNFANEVGAEVRYPNGIYFLSEVSEILVKHSVDFCGSTIIINDNPSTVSRAKELYTVDENEGSRVEHINDTLTESLSLKVNRETKKIPELAGNGIAFVEIYDDSDLILARYGNYIGGGARPKTDCIKVDNEGNLLSEVTYDFKNVTRIVIHSIPEKKIILKNGHFKSIGENRGGTNSYYKRNILIKRSNVQVDNITHTIDDFVGKEPAHGFIRTEYCCDIIFHNSDFQPRMSDSSYEISNFLTLNILFDNVNAESNEPSRWGAHVGYFMKDVKFRNCNLNRIDSHYPSHNIDIDGCDIGTRGLTLTGFGKLGIRNTAIRSSAFVNLRQDYGSFWNGDIVIDNVDHYPTAAPKLFAIHPTIDWDFGVDTSFGMDKVRVSGYRLHDKLTTDFTPYLIFFVPTDSSAKVPARDYYKLCPEISFKDCKTDSGAGFGVFLMHNYRDLRGMTEAEFSISANDELFIKENILIEVENTILDYSTYYPDATGSNVSNLIQPMAGTIFGHSSVKDYSLSHLVPKFLIKNCRNVYASVMGMRAILDIQNSEVITLMNYMSGGSNSNVTLTNCTLKPRYSIDATNKYVIRTSFTKSTFINSVFKLPSSYNGKISTNHADFLTVYPLFSGVKGSSRMSISAKLIACTFEQGFNVTDLNPDFSKFNVELGTNTQPYVYRKIGTTTNRPTQPPAGLTYFDTSLSKLITHTGTNWVDSTGTTV